MTITPSVTSWFPLDTSDVPKTSFRTWASQVEADIAALQGTALGSVFNMFSDAGRMVASADNVSTYSTGYVKPGYIQSFQSTLSNQGKFIFDNSTNGGAGAALDAQTDALMQKLRNAGIYRRFGVEFHVMKALKTSIASGPGVYGGTTYYLTMYCDARPRLLSCTTHFYARATVGAVVIASANTAAKVYIDNVLSPLTTAAVLTVGDGWKAIRIVDTLPNPAITFSYSPGLFDVYQSAVNDEAMFACFTCTPGEQAIATQTGLVGAYSTWIA
jgi:hypothetical protein